MKRTNLRDEYRQQNKAEAERAIEIKLKTFREALIATRLNLKDIDQLEKKYAARLRGEIDG
jgi:hypothetical protein